MKVRGFLGFATMGNGFEITKDLLSIKPFWVIAFFYENAKGSEKSGRRR